MATDKLGRHIIRQRQDRFHRCDKCLGQSFKYLPIANFSEKTKSGLLVCNKCDKLYEYKGMELVACQQ